MKNIIFALIVTIISSVCAIAQTAEDYKKFEFFAGFSHGQIDKDPASSFRNYLTDRSQFSGFEVSAVYNVSRYVGIKGDVSATFSKSRFSVPITTGTPAQNVGFDQNTSLYNFLGGVQFKDNASKSRFKPFAHALAGAGYERMKVKNVTCPAGISCSVGQGGDNFGLAGAFGGGLDTRINKKLDFRAFQVDYNPIKFDAGMQHNARLSTGIVF